MTVNVDTQSLIASMRDVVGQAYLLTDKAELKIAFLVPISLSKKGPQ